MPIKRLKATLKVHCPFGTCGLKTCSATCICCEKDAVLDLPPWLSGLAISGRGAVKAWLAIRQGVGSYPTPAGMSSQVSA